MIRKEQIFAFFLSLSVFLLSWSYYVYFSEPLNDGVWQNIDGFTRIVIPDTFLYKNIIDFSNPIGSIVLSTVKNTIGPSLIWFVVNGEWILVSVVNSVFLFAALLYLARIARLLGIPQRHALALMSIIALLPATVYYSVGALKEIPSLLFLTGFFYHYLKRDRARWLLYALLCVLFRYQLVFPLIFFLVADRFHRRALIFAFSVLIVLSAIYPYIISWNVFSLDAVKSYRELYGEDDSLGGFLESVRNNIPGLSVIAVLVRVIQSLFEPLLAFLKNPSFYEDGDLSVLGVVYFSSAIILFRYWLLFFRRMVLLLINRAHTHRNIIRLYMFCLVFILPIAGFSFIHHRYIYPLTALVMVASAIRLKPKALLRSSAVRAEARLSAA